MNTPPFLLAAAILFWGSQTGNWEIAVPLAIAFEAPRFVAFRWELAPERLDRASDLGVALAVMVFGYYFATAGNPKSITQFFLWLPVAYVPLAIAQAWSTTTEMELATLLLGLRGVKNRRRIKVNIGYVYAALWIVGAAAANRRGIAFEIGAFVLSAWALWMARPVASVRPARVVSWIALILVAGGLALAAHTGLRNLQNWIEGNIADWIAGEGTATNPYRADTDIGRIGQIKQSERIVMRVRVDGEEGARLPGKFLLHRASYDAYSGVRWLARNAAFTTVKAAADGSWPVGAAVGGALARVSIVEESTRPNPVLSLPSGTSSVTGLQANEMKRNAMGAVQIDITPGFFHYGAQYSVGGAQASAPPGADDIAIPRAEGEAVAAIARSLNLANLAPAQRLAAIERYFAEGFRYSLFQPGESGQTQGTALIAFLKSGKAGHCEYFASATALLLRAAGIPARYATGFAVMEWSPREDAYLVRLRHAHSWVRAWIGGRWVDVDTTPPSWGEIEANDAPWWSGVADLWNWLRFRYAESQRDGEGPSPAVIAVFVVLALWIGWRLFGRAGRAAGRTQSAPAAREARGMDSDFRRIEERLAAMGVARRRDETAREWVARLRSAMPDLAGPKVLEDLAWAHTRHRFDPAGLTPEERAAFARRVAEWLSAQAAIARTNSGAQ